jgi:hypothetical protein
MNALQWIIKEAKKLRREYPKRFATWKEYVAQASAIYAKKHGGKSPVGHKRKKRKVSSMGASGKKVKHMKRRTSSKRRKAIHSLKSAHRREGAAIRRLGSVSHHVGKAKHLLEHEIGILETRKFKAGKKSTKRKIQKRITAAKSKYRRLAS